MLVADPGLGKTGMTIAALDLLKLVGSNFFPALVLAPKRVADVVWTGEAKKWSTFEGLSVRQITGTEAQRLEILRTGGADAYVVNYELVPWLVDLWPQEKWPFRIVIADECSKLKSFRINKGGKRAAALSKIARVTGRWWNLTGTPIPNSIADLWGQYWFLDFGERLKRSFTAFSEAYLIEHPYTHRITTQQNAEKDIHEKIADITIAFRAEDWLDVQKPQEIPVEFDMSESSMSRYREMERDYFMEIDDKQISAGTAMVKSAKLLQLCAGSIYDNDTNPHWVHDDRLQALDDVLEMTGNEQVLISYWWKTDPPRILKRLRELHIPARLYNGKQDEDDWNAQKFRVLLLQEQSAFGLNLHAHCRDIFHYSYTWSAELWTQMLNRVGPARQAQAGKKCVVRVWYAKARGTIENEVIDSNFKKITVEEALKRARAQRYI
jgi:SNF2 family DNA or RNA helicase